MPFVRLDAEKVFEKFVGIILVEIPNVTCESLLNEVDEVTIKRLINLLRESRIVYVSDFRRYVTRNRKKLDDYFSTAKVQKMQTNLVETKCLEKFKAGEDKLSIAKVTVPTTDESSDEQSAHKAANVLPTTSSARVYPGVAPSLSIRLEEVHAEQKLAIKTCSDKEVVPTEYHDETPRKRGSMEYSTPKSIEDIPTRALDFSPVLKTPIKKDRAVECSSDSDFDNRRPEAHIFKNVTPLKVPVKPHLIDISSVDADENHILPEGSKNVSELSPATGCDILEGTFSIKNEDWKALTVTTSGSTKLISGDYCTYFRIHIKKVNNVCVLVFKNVKYRKGGIINITGSCKHRGCKNFRFIVKDLVVSVYSSSKDYCHKKQMTSFVKGPARSIAKQELLYVKPSEYKRRKVLAASCRLIGEGNTQDIKSDATIRKIRSEAIGLLDRDRNEILDLLGVQSDHPEYIQEVAIPFCVKFYSQEQVKVLLSLKAGDGKRPVIYFDATGGVVKKPTPSLKKRIYLYTAVVHIAPMNRIVPIFQMVSEAHNSLAISKLFQDFQQFWQLKGYEWPAFSAVVTDFSFANLHAITRSCNLLSLKDYLTTAWDIASNNKEIPESLVTIHLCCAHFMKMVSKDVNSHFETGEARDMVKYLMAQCIQLKSLNEITKWAIKIYKLIMSPYYNDVIEEIRSEFESFKEEEYVGFTMKNIYPSYEAKPEEGLYASSPFYQYFSTLLERTAIRDKQTGNANEFYSPQFYSILIKKYLPFCPLWTGLIIRQEYNCDRYSNACVENYFGYLKTVVLRGQRNWRISRFLRIVREDVLAATKQVLLEIPKSRLTKRKAKHIESEVFSQETWKRKPTQMKTHFSGRFLSTKDVSRRKSPKVVQTDESSKNLCMICYQGSLDVTTSWVQCDECDSWGHQLCISPTRKSYSDAWSCSKCLNKARVAKETKQLDNVGKQEPPEQQYTDFLDSLKLSMEEIQRIEVETREQRNCNQWYDERRKRLTASNFGKVCKASSDSAIDKIVDRILSNKDTLINLPAVKFGIEHESIAISKYNERYPGSVCNAAGLCIHPDYPYLAASPDGLVGDDIVVEVKCSYRYRDLSPEKAVDELRYIGTTEGQPTQHTLLKSHVYYYQVQGLLEVTNRHTCHFVIYTLKGIYLIIIERDRDFFKNLMLPKLTDVYHGKYVPALLQKNSKCKATLKELELLPNHLVIDEQYYRPCSQIYTVGVYDREVTKYTIFNEVNSTTYEAINPRLQSPVAKYIDDCALDMCISLIIAIWKAEQFQILPTSVTMMIFNPDTRPEEFAYYADITIIDRPRIFIPCRVGGNHWILMYADFINKTFTLFDSLGLYESNVWQYFSMFNNFFRLYTQKHNVPFKGPLSLAKSKHSYQKDSFNCGPWSIYFCEQIIKNADLTSGTDMYEYRLYLRKLLLEQSQDVYDVCVFCTRIFKEGDQYSRCHCCRRGIHKHHVDIYKKYLIQDICELCRNYFSAPK